MSFKNKKTQRNRQVCDEVAAGEQMIDVGRRHGISCERVRQICQAGGIVPPTSLVGAELRRQASNAEQAMKKAELNVRRQKLFNLVNAGESIRSAAKQCGFTRGEVNTLAVRLGLYDITRYKRNWSSR